MKKVQIAIFFFRNILLIYVLNVDEKLISIFFVDWHFTVQMSINQGAVVLTKWVTGASFIILGVGIMFIPSDEEKIRKMKVSFHMIFVVVVINQIFFPAHLKNKQERIEAMDNVDEKKNKSIIDEWFSLKPKPVSTKSMEQQAKESNEKTSNVNIFKEL